MKALDHERLFEPLIDPVDGVACVSADSSPAEVAAITAPHGLRFPLQLDATAALSGQVASSGYAPASSRFGAYCDNITGMNWELPDGRRVRLGERVVKSTTGYDLLRFLIGSGNRFGRPLDYVLRLRPLCDGGGMVFFEGETEHLERVAAGLLRSSYIHWLESVDWIVAPSAQALRVGVHCPAAEWSVFQDFLTAIARRNEVHSDVESGNGMVDDGCPDLVMKTTPDRVAALTREVVAISGARCVALCYCAAVHVYLPQGPDLSARISALAEPLADSLHRMGGDWQSRHVARAPHSSQEAAWLATLTREWQIPT